MVLKYKAQQSEFLQDYVLKKKKKKKERGRVREREGGGHVHCPASWRFQPQQLAEVLAAAHTVKIEFFHLKPTHFTSCV
jgi:hypothetical protein